MKIYVAIPVYDGKLPIQTVIALLNEQAFALGSGDDIQVGFITGNAGIVQGRNQLAQEFMETGFDKLVFLDSDITFAPGALIKLAHKPVDFVGGCYRYKMQTEEKYPITFLDKPELWADENGLIEVNTLPTGFLALSRNVFDTFVKTHPERVNEHFGRLIYTFFQMPFVDGVQWGEDTYFCKEWRDMGGKVYLDPEIELTHWSFSPVPVVGHIGKWLKNRPQESATA